MDQIDMGDIEEERHAAKHGDEIPPAPVRALEGCQQYQGRPESHHQIKERGWIFLAVDEGEHARQRILLRLPCLRITVEIAGTQQDEADDEGGPGTEQQLPTTRSV